MNPVMQAVLWMTGAIVSFSSMGIAGRELGSNLDTFEIMLYRSVIGLVIIVAILTLAGRWHEITRRHLGTHILRNMAHFTGQNLWFYAVTVLPLAQVFALEFTTPIWVILLAPLLLGERLTPVRLLCALLGFVGILIVARPGVSDISAGTVTAASSAIFFAMTMILTKRLTRNVTLLNILFYLTLTQLFMGSIAAGYDFDLTLPDQSSLPWIILVGLAGLLAHTCLTRALTIASAAVVAPMDFARLPAIAVIAMILYAEPLDPYVFVGAALIFLGNYINILREGRNT